MTDEPDSNDNEKTEGLGAAEEEIDEEPGSGAGPAADMDKAEPVESEEEQNEGDYEQSRIATVASAAVGSANGGVLALLGGGVALARAVQMATRNRGRAAVGALAGGALIGLGLYQRRSPDEAAPMEDDSQDVSDEAPAAAIRTDTGRQPETRAGGEVTDKPTAEATDEEESGLAATDEQGDEPRPKPELDEDVADPRHHPDEDVELSEATIADEPGEATGPDSEQAQPAQTEDTEPDPSPPEDASHTEADVPDDETTDEGDESKTTDTETDGP